MDPKRLQKIIEPLETLLVKHNFKIDEAPLVDGASRMASFTRPDGKRVDYHLEVKKDQLRDWGGGFADYELLVEFCDVGKSPVVLCECSLSTNISTTTSVAEKVREDVEPTLNKYL